MNDMSELHDISPVTPSTRVIRDDLGYAVGYISKGITSFTTFSGTIVPRLVWAAYDSSGNRIRYALTEEEAEAIVRYPNALLP